MLRKIHTVRRGLVKVISTGERYKIYQKGKHFIGKNESKPEIDVGTESESELLCS